MYSLTTLKLALGDMLTKRIDDVRLTEAGKYFEARLMEHLAEIDALPAALTGEAPYADELAEQDGRHDGFGAMIYHITESCFRDPKASPELLAAAQRLRTAFIPALGELTNSYATEAERAQKRRPLLKSMEADLKTFPVSGSPGRTLLDVATSFLDEGDNINATLSKRADVLQQTRKAAAVARSTAEGTVNRFRADLVREIGRNPSLPRDLEARVFGYLDTLHSMAASAKAAPAQVATDTTTPPVDGAAAKQPEK
jgi:hypothetical protein